CGKSNIIDAVRWVMGESSAKHLRGESMTDVIFNGAATRKPVGQASIELIFDNSLGKLQGEYANFGEVAIRRKVTREGTSEYFLNGTKCRRRDITDIFLGTGLGPRSYAIIEQGMISKLIESKPDELRVYIEEAAGISKYKERRKETESRMRRTQENLDRLTDIREELDRQLQHLHRQAVAAEKYTELKKDERLKKAQLIGMKWKSLNDAMLQQDQVIQTTEVELEKAISHRTGNDSGIEDLRLQQHEKAEKLSRIQESFYQASSEIARLEQALKHQKERIDQVKRDRDEGDIQYRHLLHEIEDESARLESINEELVALEPEFEERQALSEDAGERLAIAEEEMHQWQHNWDDFNLRSSEARKNAELEQSHIQNLEQSIRKHRDRLEKLRQDTMTFRDQLDTSEIHELSEQLLQEEKIDALLKEEIEGYNDQVEQAREHVVGLDDQLSLNRKQEQELSGRLASIKALQEAMLGQDDSLQIRWLQDAGLDGMPRLAECLSVESQWRKAAETVLRPFLNGLCVDSLESLDPEQLRQAPFPFIQKTVVGALQGEKQSQNGKQSQDRTLSSVVNVNLDGACQPMLQSLLSSVLLVDSLEDGLYRRKSLVAGSSLLTPEGYWLGADWLICPDQEQSGSTLDRQAELRTLSSSLEECLAARDQLVADLEHHRQSLQDAEAKREACRGRQSQLQRTLSEIQSRLSGLKAKQEQISARIGSLDDELSDTELALEMEEGALLEARERWHLSMQHVDQDADERERLLANRDEIRASFDQLRQQARHSKDQSHQLQLRVENLRSQRHSLTTALERFELQKNQLSEKLEAWIESLEELIFPIDDMQIELEALLERRVFEEEGLAKAREELDQVEQQLRSGETDRHQIEQRVQTVRGQLQDQRMALQALEIKRNGLIEQLKEENHDLKTVVDTIPEEATIALWEEELGKIAQRVSRLGAINLAAIEEYKIQSERKSYLDTQHEDLIEALETLETAIRKIDKETRSRFKDTFEQVNNGLQMLFPKVFGGGHAYLELTGDDLLETGVAIMARPPGKKNSTIHLLSGGEKALTAIALIFSIFQLNPAPFCMLDEVDAPLDDANVARYANMVKEMSSQVQFIYISHNKIAMEMADQLMGVTMHEPGVSRLVSVDVEEAVALAEI
ncbi:MAG: chromosome segregation protein SMC, partial [Pseudomonadales bacterium]|nr:chromosome segregation protein SMC [Pseudomonadales bacterium]